MPRHFASSQTRAHERLDDDGVILTRPVPQGFPIEVLPLIRNSLGKDFPIIFDSGIRGGSDIVRALALGADFTMVGRPLMYGIGADGAKGLKRIVDIIKEEVSTALGLVGLNDIKDISSDIIAERFIREFKY